MYCMSDICETRLEKDSDCLFYGVLGVPLGEDSALVNIPAILLNFATVSDV